jgi:hypothetical protein
MKGKFIATLLLFGACYVCTEYLPQAFAPPNGISSKQAAIDFQAVDSNFYAIELHKVPLTGVESKQFFEKTVAVLPFDDVEGCYNPDSALRLKPPLLGNKIVISENKYNKVLDERIRDSRKIPVLKAQADDPATNLSWGEFFKLYWGRILLGFLGFVEVLVRLTPTTKDNSILSFIMLIVNGLIPNFKEDGGTHQ